MTPVTTWALVRSGQASILRSLVPVVHASMRFLEHDYEVPFDVWSEENAEASLRRFEVVELPSYEPPPVSNYQVQEETAIAQVRVAYPNSFALYGARAASSLRDLIDSDRRQITDELGLMSNYVTGLNFQAVESAITLRLEAVSILELEVGLKYYRSHAA